MAKQLPDDLNQLLNSSASKVVSKKSTAPTSKPAPVKAGPPKTASWYATLSNRVNIERRSYWARENKSDIVNKALEEYFERNPEHLDQPAPKEPQA